MSSRITLIIVLAVAVGSQAELVNQGWFSVDGLKPSTNGYNGGGVVFIPGGTDSIGQDTLIVNWREEDALNPGNHNHVFQRITIPGDGGTPTVLATATLPWNLKYDGVTNFGSSGPSDLAFDAASNRLVGTFTPASYDRRFFSFDLFGSDTTIGSVGYSKKIADNASVFGKAVVMPDGRYMSFYRYTYSPNVPHWAKVSIAPADMNGAVDVLKEYVELSDITGWYPNPNDYPYTTNGYNCEGAVAYDLASMLMIRNFRNDSATQEAHLHLVGGALDADAINGYADLGDLIVLDSRVNGRAAYGITVDPDTDIAYVRFAQHNHIGNYNSILMVTIPEPAGLLLVAAGVGLWARRRRES